MEAKAAMVIGWIADSVPPAITTSARPMPQVLQRVDDRLGARRARGGDGAGVGARTEVHRDGRRGGVRHEHRHGHRHHAPGALLAQRVPRVQEGPDAADAGREVDAEALRFDIGGAGIRPRLARGHERELRGRIEALGLGALEHRVRADERLGGEGHGELVLLHPVVLEGAGAGCAREQSGPALGRGPSDAERTRRFR